MSEVSLVMRYARRWIHYGLLGHSIICTVIAAIEGVLGQ